MSERWKFQLKVGIFWGLFMIVFMTLMDWKEKPILTEVTLPKFYVKLAIYLLVGIFGLGYFNWKEKEKQEKKNQ
ncbi:hypothetical protein [Flavobacterium sp.]|uniref:hypothetical protein n=1 Tax=Flavobacterium sp. TaxID=239 RepID=UPI002FD89F7B